ncbi:MAG: helix-turn-helix domain-containing protein [Chloroflexota bacterium]
MTRVATTKVRSYRSQLRAQQAEETRARILDAALRVIAGGLAFVSVPGVAREAGVSVPTVYRHFATKHDLLAAVYPHAMRRAGLEEQVIPRSMDELRQGLRAYFERTDSLGDLARAAMASPASDDVRRLNIPRRLAAFRRVADSIEPKPSQVNQDRIARLLVILTASSALRLWRDQLGSSVDEAADDVDWVLRAITSAASENG